MPSKKDNLSTKNKMTGFEMTFYFGDLFMKFGLRYFMCFYCCTDSKVLSEEKRDGIFKSISSSEGSEWLGWKVEVLSPSAISNGMLQR